MTHGQRKQSQAEMGMKGVQGFGFAIYTAVDMTYQLFFKTDVTELFSKDAFLSRQKYSKDRKATVG